MDHHFLTITMYSGNILVVRWLIKISEIQKNERKENLLKWNLEMTHMFCLQIYKFTEDVADAIVCYLLDTKSSFELIHDYLSVKPYISYLWQNIIWTATMQSELAKHVFSLNTSHAMGKHRYFMFMKYWLLQWCDLQLVFGYCMIDFVGRECKTI